MSESTFEKLKRLGVTLLTMGLIALNKKLGLDLGIEEIGGISAAAVGYVLSGTWKASQAKKNEAMIKHAEVEAKAAGEQVKTLNDSLGIVNDLIGGSRSGPLGVGQ